mgnify:CR=1 FL=1
MMRLRRNADPTAKDLYSVAVDAVKEARLVRGDKAKRKALMDEAAKLYKEGRALDEARMAAGPKGLKLHPVPVPDELSQWSGLPKSDQRTIDGLAELIGVDDYETIREHNSDYVWETAHYQWDGGDVSEDDAAHDAFMEFMGQFEDELVFRPWHHGVYEAAARMFDDHGLSLVPVGRVRAGQLPYLYKITPTSTWRAAADKIIDTINGVGYFNFSSVKTFTNQSGGTTREAVLDHLHHMRRRPEVYGDHPYRRTYERAWP